MPAIGGVYWGGIIDKPFVGVDEGREAEELKLLLAGTSVARGEWRGTWRMGDRPWRDGEGSRCRECLSGISLTGKETILGM